MSVKVRWLDAFPKRWPRIPSKRLFPESKKRASVSAQQLSATQEYGVILQSEFMRLAGRSVVQLNQHLDKRKRVELDDFVISMRSFQGGLERAWVAGGIRSSYVVIKPTPGVHVGYFSRLFKSADYIQALQATANFIRDGQDLNYQNFSLVDLPLPPMDEQKVIADFLDYETIRLDALIEKQERLTALLIDKRVSVITNAVIKGLDPNASMRNPNKEWIPAIPEHWNDSVLGFECSVKARLGWKGLKAEEYVDDGYIFLATPNIKGKRIDFDKVNFITEQRYLESPEIMLRVGDVLVTKDGSTTGTTNLVRHLPKAATVNSSIAVLRSFGKLDSEYLFYFFKSAYVQNVINRVRDGMGVPHLFQADLKKFFVPIPPVEEQVEIAGHLNGKCDKLDLLITKQNHSVELLRERRTALISAAVTGKIDVRGWKPPSADSQLETEMEVA